MASKTKSKTEQQPKSPVRPLKGGNRVVVWPLMAVLLLCSLLVWKFKAGAKTLAPGKTCLTEFISKPGPWGPLKCTRFKLEPPDKYAVDSLKLVGPSRWFFNASSKAEAMSQLRVVGFSQSEMHSLDQAKWEQANGGIWVSPGESFVLKMTRDCRTRLADILAAYPQNPFYKTPFIYRADRVQYLIDKSGLNPSVLNAFTNMFYPRGSLLLFSDIGALMSQIPEEKEKLRLIKTLSRKSTLLVKLQLDKNSDIENLLSYWGENGRADEIRPLLESLNRVEEGCEVDITQLLPTFLRNHIYTYPPPIVAANAPNEDCHWSSLNFFNDVPNDSFGRTEEVEKAFEHDFVPVTSDKKLGDIVLFMNSKGDILHSAVYIADDIVFTKNGGRRNQPWMLMTLEDLIPAYAFSKEPIRVVFCRRKTPTAS